nr:hypothetical protein [Tanacetum cinerariifolium]
MRGYRQEKGIDFEGSFVLVVRMEASRIFLAYVTHKSFIVFQMDVKIAFQHGTLKEDVTIDPTLFIRCFDDDILVDSGFKLTGFSYADYAGCKDTFKSTFGGAQFLGEKLLKGYARSAENKRRLENNPRDNRGQQSIFKQENIGGQNVARGYMAGNNERKRYIGSLTYYNKCKLHHKGPYTVRYGDCKRVGHQTKDCRSAAAALNTQRGAIGNQLGIVCYECGRPGHFRKDCPKLRNQNRGNKTGNKTRSNEATGKAYGIRGGANPDSNVITGTSRLNNCYASLLFDSGADRSFVSSTFSALLDVAPSTLDTSYAVELADGRNSKTNIILRGCTLGLLDAKNHAMIVCDEKVVRIPYGDEVLITQSDDIDGRIMPKKEDDKSEERRIEDVPIIWEFSEVFPEDFPGLPPARQVKFQIDLVPGAAPITRSLYRLALAEMQELSTQLQELSDKGFIRPSSSP